MRRRRILYTPVSSQLSHFEWAQYEKTSPSRCYFVEERLEENLLSIHAEDKVKINSDSYIERLENLYGNYEGK